MDPHIWTIIAKHSHFYEVVKIRSLCRRIRQLVFHLKIPTWIEVNDNIINLYLPNIQWLDAGDNSNITDASVKHLTNLRTLDAYGSLKITDEGIKNLTNLQTLNASHNPNITDEGIKNLTNLQWLYAYHNPNITNEGIKHLKKLQKFNEIG
jgi:Leucine-rich repeat (LRR) protein